MSDNTKYSLLFILLGIVLLLLGLIGEKPTYGGGWIRKYESIIVGVISLLYGLVSLFNPDA